MLAARDVTNAIDATPSRAACNRRRSKTGVPWCASHLRPATPHLCSAQQEQQEQQEQEHKLRLLAHLLSADAPGSPAAPLLLAHELAPAALALADLTTLVPPPASSLTLTVPAGAAAPQPPPLLGQRQGGAVLRALLECVAALAARVARHARGDVSAGAWHARIRGASPAAAPSVPPLQPRASDGGAVGRALGGTQLWHDLALPPPPLNIAPARSERVQQGAGAGREVDGRGSWEEGCGARAAAALSTVGDAAGALEAACAALVAPLAALAAAALSPAGDAALGGSCAAGFVASDQEGNGAGAWVGPWRRAGSEGGGETAREAEEVTELALRALRDLACLPR